MAAVSKSYPWESREARLEHQRLSRRLVRASDVQAEAVEYLDSAAAGRFPRGLLTLIAGRPKQGKSLLSNWLAGEITRAGGAVILSNPEDMLATMKLPRMQAADADCGRVHFWPGKIRLPDDVEELETLIQFHGVDLVVIDPIRKHVGHNVAASLEPLAQMAERTGVAVIMIHHLTKQASKTDHPMDAFGGALSDYVGTARALYAFGPVSGGEPETRILAPAGSNVGPGDTSAEFYLDGDVEIDLANGDVAQPGRLVFVDNACATDALAVVTYNGGFSYKSDTPEKKAVAGEFLTLLLMRGPVTANEVFDEAAECGVSKATMRRAAEEIGIVKKRIGFGPGSYLTWELPEGHPALVVSPTMNEGDADPIDGQMDVDEVIAAILGEDEDGGGDDE